MFELVLLFGGLTREVMEDSSHKPQFSNLPISVCFYVSENYTLM